MGHHRGFKSFKTAAHRGFKQIAGVAKRGHTFLAEHVKSIGDADTIARKTANTLHNAGEWGPLYWVVTG